MNINSPILFLLAATITRTPPTTATTATKSKTMAPKITQTKPAVCCCKISLFFALVIFFYFFLNTISFFLKVYKKLPTSSMRPTSQLNAAWVQQLFHLVMSQTQSFANVLQNRCS